MVIRASFSADSRSQVFMAVNHALSDAVCCYSDNLTILRQQDPLLNVIKKSHFPHVKGE